MNVEPAAASPAPGARHLGHPLRCPHEGLPVTRLRFERPGAWVREGAVLDLAREEHYWNHLSVEQMRRLNADVRAEGWRVALDRHLRPSVDSYTYAYATDERRADGLWLCGLPPASRVLDVGAGWGAVTTALARWGHRVTALDSNLETLEFLALRTAQEGLADQVAAVRIDPLERAPLPIEDRSVDLVVLNGVLEWVGAGVTAGSPVDHQRRVLEEARRVLAPGGALYLAIESRWGLSMWFGGEDHPGTRYTSVVPRWIASVITRRAGKGPYRTWTHGHGALSALLAEAGFARRRFHAPFPDYRFPHSIVPLQDAGLFRRAIRRPGLSPGHARLLQACSLLGLHRDAVSHFVVVARP